ncbi:MAG: hypothetical protein FD141_814 [Fusobacteria bacterium]|nr:MAG: hypothetical protein FD141_814 [Fusobacteriota bacterium]KAF0228520.1 MAG: hypothetical protein FD182_776 [Fusobacteriota bacterium]
MMPLNKMKIGDIRKVGEVGGCSVEQQKSCKH